MNTDSPLQGNMDTRITSGQDHSKLLILAHSSPCSETSGVGHKLFFFHFIGLHLQQMEVPRLEVKSELQLLGYATATAKLDSSLICGLHHGLQQWWILNPLREARVQTCILMDTSGVRSPLSHNRNSHRYCFSISNGIYFTPSSENQWNK